MTTWTPELSNFDGPRYRRIADAIATDISQGRLPPGSKMPTQRDLAWRLGMTIGTVTRAYSEAENRGLITGEVGRGTFVREPVPDIGPRERRAQGDDGFINLAHNFPRADVKQNAIAEHLAEIAQDGSLPKLMEYQPSNGRREHRDAMAQWITARGLPCAANDLVLSTGAQHGMLLAISALTRPGDILLTEELTFYGVKTIATSLGLRLYGLDIDQEGITPAALEAACRNTGAKVLYTIPTLQNPTTAIMSPERRQAIAEICRRYDVAIVEDDVYGFLPRQAQSPLASFAPERTLYVVSLSKAVAPGLRIGAIKAPRNLIEDLCHEVNASTIMATPLMAELSARLVRSGRAEDMTRWQRQEAQARQKIACTILPQSLLRTHPDAFHLWLTLPAPWRREFFALEARDRGIGVGSAELFAVGQQPVPHAVRLCLQAAHNRDELERALTVICDILEGPASGNAPVV